MVAGPRNTAVIVGQKLEMKCQVDNDVKVYEWLIQRTLASKTETLFTNSKNKSKISNPHFGVDVNQFGSAGVLYANSTALEDAGIYICAIPNGTEQTPKYSAHLIVFGKFFI